MIGSELLMLQFNTASCQICVWPTYTETKKQTLHVEEKKKKAEQCLFMQSTHFSVRRVAVVLVIKSGHESLDCHEIVYK